ncbi:MAG: hypothetical protein DRJ11_11780 [Candidatus Aminicenantes bacterium]|nr:MAG: hypothetical protein DRJ11_11780 [Candidatus Aminicenantes bacterium]
MYCNLKEELKKTLPLTLFLLVSFVSSFSRCGDFQRSQKNQPRQAILILLDAARPDHFSCYGYPKPTTPEIDLLAKNGVRFLNCYTQGINTRTALPCLIFSRYFIQPIFPNHHSIPFENPVNLFRRLDREAISIPKTLEREGFITAAIVAHEWLTEGTKFAKEFKELYNLHTIVKYDKKYAYPRADKVIDFTIKWLELNREKDFFLYIHIMDTHFPHFFEEDAKSFFGEGHYNEKLFAPSGLPINPNVNFSADDLRYLNSLYDGSLRYTSRQIGRLVNFLKNARILNQVLIVITADHGEFLLDRKGMISHVGKWYDPVAKIPLIIHFPQKIEPQEISSISELIDIGPTILGLLGVKIPEGKSMDGENLLDGLVVREKVREMHGKKKNIQKGREAFIGMGVTGVRDVRFKCLFNWPAARLLRDSAPSMGGEARAAGLKAEIYDLVEDPKEMNPLMLGAEGVGSEGRIILNRLYKLYQQRMRPLYKRYESAKTDKQPELAFAISSASFSTDLKIPYFKGPDILATVKEAPKKNGWVRRSSWDNSWLFAAAGEGTVPIKISFPVPDGLYFLSLDINGCCEMEVGGTKKIVCSPEFVQDLRWKTNRVDFGPVKVKGKVFRAWIRPIFSGFDRRRVKADEKGGRDMMRDEGKGGGGKWGGGSNYIKVGKSQRVRERNYERDWFAIRLLGFEPIINGQIRSMRDRKIDKEKLKRLRSLGYIK